MKQVACLEKGVFRLKFRMYNHESKKAESINKYVADDEVKHEDYKNIFFKRSFMIHAMNRIQSKDNDIG